jgi:hypothetical protein
MSPDPGISYYLTIRKPLAYSFAAIALALLVLNVILIDQNRILKRMLASPAPSLLPPVGVPMPPLEGLGISGSRVSVPYRDLNEQTLVLVFSPICPICAQNWPKWLALSDAVNLAHARTAYVNIVGRAPEDYLQQRGAPADFFIVQIDPKSEIAYNLRYSPETIMIDRSGKIVRVWVGLLNDQDMADIKNLLGRATASTQIPAFFPGPEVQSKPKGETSP